MAISVVILTLEYKYRSYKSPVDTVFGELGINNKDIDYIYIGSSHMGIVGEYNPDSNAIVKNFAFQGLDLFKQYTILKKWLPKMEKLKGVLLCLDYELIGQNQTLSGEPHLDRQFYKYTDTLYANSFTNRLLSKSIFFSANRDLNYIFNQQKNIPTKKDFSEFIPVESRSNINETDCRKRAKELSQIKFKKEVVNENTAYLKLIITLCQNNNIQLYLFNPPKRECYRANVNEANVLIAKDAVYTLLNEMNVKYYDFYNDKDFDDYNFADYDHLNQNGAIKLIDKIFK
jgi:hypothetical protein